MFFCGFCILFNFEFLFGANSEVRCKQSSSDKENRSSEKQRDEINELAEDDVIRSQQTEEEKNEKPIVEAVMEKEDLKNVDHYLYTLLTNKADSSPAFSKISCLNSKSHFHWIRGSSSPSEHVGDLSSGNMESLASCSYSSSSTIAPQNGSDSTTRNNIETPDESISYNPKQTLFQLGIHRF